MVAVGEAPGVALNRVEAAIRERGFSSERSEGRVMLGVPGVDDYLVVTATEMDVGTRVELRGHIQPEVPHAVLQALAKSRPWTWAPAWDEASREPRG